MALRSLSTAKPVKMGVKWQGSRQTLTGTLFVNVATSFLTTHVAIDSNLSGGTQGQGGDIASRAMVDGLCAMAHITEGPPLRRRTSVLQFLRLDTPGRYGPK